MKTKIKNIGLLFLAALSFISCDDNENPEAPATPAQFTAVREAALDAQTQTFTATAGAGSIVLTSSKGVTINLNGNALTKNGTAVTGAIDIEFVEIFDKGTMLVTNKPTMGVMPDGKKSLLISGGEFFIKASQGGIDLVSTGTIQLQIPGNLTGGTDPQMTFWVGDNSDADNFAWKQQILPATTGLGEAGNVNAKGDNYVMTFGSFGWTNVDKFYSDPRPRTTILAAAPAGYDNTNSAIYLSYDGEGTNALAQLDTYTSAGLFSEHYGQIPIGLACHVIFATEDNGQWRYAIKAVTVQANDVYTFTMWETTVGSEAQLVAAINAIQ